MHSFRSSAKPLTIALGLVAVSVLTTPRPVCAQTFTVTLTGTVTGMNYSGTTGITDPWGPGVQVGTPFTETFTWDRSVPANPITAIRTRWETQDIARGADITMGGLHISPFQNTNQTGTDPVVRDYWIQTTETNGNRAGSPPGIAFVSTAGLMTGADSRLLYESVETALYDPTDTATVSLTDPGADWLNPALTGSEFNLSALGPSDQLYNLWGVVTSVSGVGLTPAPEPSQSAALAVGTLGLAGLGIRARRRRSGFSRSI